MHNECQNIFIAEVVSLILLCEKLATKHNRQLVQSCNRTNKSRIEIVSTDSVNSL